MSEAKTHVHRAARTLEFCAWGATRTDDGEWINDGKDPLGVALGHKATAMSTPEQRQERASVGGSKRWEGKTAKQRSAYMSEIASRPRPSRRNEDRCECGRYTRERAEKRNHVCGKALEERLV
jgi:hypothetical protein